MQSAPGEALRPGQLWQHELNEQEEEQEGAAGYASDGVSMDCGPA